MRSFLAQQTHLLGKPRAERADPGLEIALQAAGSVTRLATLLGLSHATVSLWRKIPKRHVPRIEIGLGIPPHEQRPDAFPILARPAAGPPSTTRVSALEKQSGATGRRALLTAAADIR